MSVLLPMRDVPPGCKVYLLAIPAEAQVLRDMLDLAIKQALPHGHPLASCFVQGEHTPWYHVLEARGLAPGAERPLEVMRFAGKPYPPLRVGNLEYFYLNAENVPELGAEPRATFYSFDGARFVDVTEDVRSGRRIVPFYNNRPPY